MMREMASKLDVSITDEQAEQFERYLKLLLEYNAKFNLTAIREPADIRIKHFLDSLTCLAPISAEFPEGGKDGVRLIDVGSGAGFPGLPLKIARTDIHLTLLDSLNKRVRFLDAVREELALTNVRCVHMRAEDAGRLQEYRGRYDVALSRAVASLSLLAEYCLPLVSVGGFMLAMKGPDPSEEVASASALIERLGGSTPRVVAVTLPDTDITHSLVIIKKRKPTPVGFPRNSNKIGK